MECRGGSRRRTADPKGEGEVGQSGRAVAGGGGGGKRGNFESESRPQKKKIKSKEDDGDDGDRAPGVTIFPFRFNSNEKLVFFSCPYAQIDSAVLHNSPPIEFASVRFTLHSLPTIRQHWSWMFRTDLFFSCRSETSEKFHRKCNNHRWTMYERKQLALLPRRTMLTE